MKTIPANRYELGVLADIILRSCDFTPEIIDQLLKDSSRELRDFAKQVLAMRQKK